MKNSEVLRIRMLCQIDNIAAITYAQSHIGDSSCEEYQSLQGILDGFGATQRKLEQKMGTAYQYEAAQERDSHE